MHYIQGRDIDTRERLYWSNTFGWTSVKDERTIFTDQERNTFGLPDSNTVEQIEWCDHPDLTKT